MRPIAPRIDDPRCQEITVAEDQHEYQTLTAARVQCTDGKVEMCTRWTLTKEEREAIARGEDVYVFFPEFVYPHRLMLRPEWARI